MTKTKKQHYIPRFYLRNFSIDDSNIFVFDKPSMKSFRAKIDQIAQEKYFYDTNPGDIQITAELYEEDPDLLVENLRRIIVARGDEDLIRQFEAEVMEPDFLEKLRKVATDPQYMEREILAPFEHRAAKLLNEVIRELRKRNRVKRGQRIDLATMMTIQLMRTPKFRYEVIDFQEKMMNELVKTDPLYDPDGDVVVTYNRDVEDRITASFLTDGVSVRAITRILLGHIWCIGINSSSKPLYTSDAPLVKYMHVKGQTQGIGLASYGVEVVYPVNDKYALLLYERSYFQDKLHDGKNIKLSEKAVDFYNTLQVLQSRRQVYSKSDNFDVAKDMCLI